MDLQLTSFCRSEAARWRSGARSWMLCLVAGVWLAAGCQPGPAETERAAHREPANRPADLAAAHHQLQTLAARLNARLMASPPSAAEEAPEWPAERARLAELVQWLPELAADSDLNEVGWQQIQTSAAAFEQRLRHLGPSPSALTPAAWQKLDLAGLVRDVESWLAQADRARSSPLTATAGSR